MGPRSLSDIPFTKLKSTADEFVRMQRAHAQGAKVVSDDLRATRAPTPQKVQLTIHDGKSVPPDLSFRRLRSEPT